MTDKDRINFLERKAKLSRTGITFEWLADKDHTGYRYMANHRIGSPFKTIREAIDYEIKQEAIR
jgi:hypothetical protein